MELKCNLVSVRLTDHGKGEVFVDGVKLERVKSISITASAGRDEPNRVTIELISESVEFDGRAVVFRNGS